MEIDGFDIEVIRSKRRKTLCINIERNGSVNVRVPDGLAEDEIRTILTSKTYEIHKRIAGWKELNKERIIRKFADGQSFLYLGKNYNLKIVSDQQQSLIIKNNTFLLNVEFLATAENTFIHFYKVHGKPLILERIAHFQSLIPRKPNSVKILDLKTRWASCTPGGNLNFHWKCVMAPPQVLDYLIVHELVHLIHRNHSRVFWDMVSAIMPDYQLHIVWLQRNGVKLTI
jgi:predicted metal-dependent hydrolase